MRAGLASATAKRVVAGSRTMEVVTVRITDAGRRAPEKAVVRDKADCWAGNRVKRRVTRLASPAAGS
jgi:hypothetical protein